MIKEIEEFINQHNENLKNGLLDDIKYEVKPKDYAHEVFDPNKIDLPEYIDKNCFSNQMEYKRHYLNYISKVADYYNNCVSIYPELSVKGHPESIKILYVAKFKPIDDLLKKYKFRHYFSVKEYLDKFLFKILSKLFTDTLCESIGKPELISDYENASNEYKELYQIIAESLISHLWNKLYGKGGYYEHRLSQGQKKKMRLSNIKFTSFYMVELSEALNKGIIPFIILSKGGKNDD